MPLVITHAAGTKTVNGMDNVAEGSTSGSSSRISVWFSSFVAVCFTGASNLTSQAPIKVTMALDFEGIAVPDPA